jgi:hypothetical protein
VNGVDICKKSQVWFRLEIFNYIGLRAGEDWGTTSSFYNRFRLQRNYTISTQHQHIDVSIPRSLLCKTNTDKVMSQSPIKKTDKNGYSYLDYSVHKYLKSQINSSWEIRVKVNWLYWDSWLCNAWVQKFESGGSGIFRHYFKGLYGLTPIGFKILNRQCSNFLSLN